MFSQIWQESNLLFQNKLLKDKVDAFESGVKYTKMQEEHQKDLVRKDRQIKRMEKELVQAHREISDVRNKWFQTCEDILKEKDCALVQKDRELHQMKGRMYEAQRQRDGAAADDEAVMQLEARYDEIMERAKEEYEYVPPGDYFRDGYNLYKRMKADKPDYLLFLHDLNVEPTNNLAERDGRKFKRKAAQVMGFRSMKGVTYFCDGLSVIQTMKLKNGKIYETVASLFNNGRETGE